MKKVKLYKSPCNDKRNFKRTDPRYAEYQKMIFDTNGKPWLYGE